MNHKMLLIVSKHECNVCGTLTNVLQEEIIKIKHPLKCSCGTKGRSRLLTVEIKMGKIDYEEVK